MLILICVAYLNRYRIYICVCMVKIRTDLYTVNILINLAQTEVLHKFLFLNA